MIEIAKKILNNKPDYAAHLACLDAKYESRFTKKLERENNDINVLSIFSEIEFGITLNDLFDEVQYEPKIYGKTPDWVVKSNGENLIFEVKKINPVESEMQRRIDLAKIDEYIGIDNLGPKSKTTGLESQIHKIANKEIIYRNIASEHNYKLIICFDVINLHDVFVTYKDVKYNFDFDSKHSIVNKFEDFSKHVSGIIGKPLFGGMTFVGNTKSKYILNDKNLAILNTLKG